MQPPTFRPTVLGMALKLTWLMALALIISHTRTTHAAIPPESIYTLDIHINGAGRVTLDPPGGYYIAGTFVTATATAKPGAIFTGWQGDGDSSHTVHTLVMDSTKQLIANFDVAPAPAQFSLDVQVGGEGTGMVTLDPPGGHYLIGTVVTLTATPDADSIFLLWSGDTHSPHSTFTVTMDRDLSLFAHFDRLLDPVLYTLNVEIAGDGEGGISLDPIGGRYTPGTTVTITSHPAIGSSFTGWDGDATASEEKITLVMADNKHLIATFAHIPDYTGTPSINIPASLFLPFIDNRDAALQR